MTPQPSSPRVLLIGAGYIGAYLAQERAVTAIEHKANRWAKARFIACRYF